METEKSSNIIARWEWRTFTDNLGSAETLIRQHPCTRLIKSDEIYLIHDSSGQNLKIRDDLLNIKLLLEVNASKLERWIPSLKAEFPLSRDDLQTFYRATDSPIPPDLKDSYSKQAFMAELIEPALDLQAVPVAKERHGFIIREAMVEIAKLQIDGQHCLTAAVEHADPALVTAVVQELGLQKFENINYVKGIRKCIKN